MSNIDFKKLYQQYQSQMLRTFEEAVESYGWKITSREYQSGYSKDISRLKLDIQLSEDPKDIMFFYFRHSWMELLFVDRDEIPPHLDLNIFDPRLGMHKAIHIARGRAEILDAINRKDNKKLDFLGKSLGRFTGTRPVENDSSKEEIEFHYENGILQPDTGKVVTNKSSN